MSKLKKIAKEKYLFLLLIVLNALPLFVAPAFITLDGGAHAYNANVIKELIFNSESVYHNYYEFNPEPVPNWITHILLVAFHFVLPYALAEKLLVFLFFVLTPYFFRKTILLLNPDNRAMSYTILPFLHFLMLYLGFFNFTYGILFCFVGIYYFTLHQRQLNVKSWAILFFIFALTYFSHIFPFIILLMYCMSALFFSYLKEDGVSLKLLFSKLIKGMLPKLILMVVLVSPFLYLLNNYFAARPTFNREIFIEKIDLLRMIYRLKPLQVYSDDELRYTKLMTIWIGIFGLVTIFFLIKNYFQKKQSFIKDIINHNFIFLSIVLAVLLYVTPDDDGYGGFISIRITLFIWYFIVFWMAVQHTNLKLQWIFVAGLISLQIPLLMKRVNGIQWTYSGFTKVKDMANYIEPGSKVVQLDFDDANWLGHHLSNYIATDKPIIVLDNYEATKKYFPLIWKDDFIPNLKIASVNMFETCNYWKSNPYNPETDKVDYVLLLGERPNEECYEKTKLLIAQNCIPVISCKNVSLYKVKSGNP
jgi:hypothetical protein